MMVTYQSESIRIFTDPDHDIVFIESPDGGESLAIDTPDDCKATILHLQELHARLVKKYMNSVALPNAGNHGPA